MTGFHSSDTSFTQVKMKRIMREEHRGYELDTDLARIQFHTVHSWLTQTYWSPGVNLEKVIRAAENSSIVVGAYTPDSQVGYLRIVSDRTSFAWVCDVFVHPDHRGQAIARAMLSFAMSDQDHQGLRRWLLATKDAHGVYAHLGFESIRAPSRWMVRGSNPPD